MSSNDKDIGDLFARLNALKAPKSVPQAKAVPHPSIKPKNADDDIASRFRRLASGDATAATTAAVTPGRSSISPNLGEPSASIEIVHGIPSETVHNEEEDQSLEDLLRELGEDHGSWLKDAPEETKISDLLREAKNALPTTQAEDEPDPEQPREGTQVVMGEDETEEQAQHQDEQDEQDADEYIAQVLAERELRRRDGTLSEDGKSESEEEGGGSKTPIDTSRDARESTPFDDLPSAPSTAPVQDDVADDDLEARFASLSLPSTPSAQPASAKKTTGSSSTKGKSNQPNYTDEDIESWCVICNEDATVRCLDCEGDLYCQECWNEGHRGPDAGYDEKTHKAVAYNRGEKKKQKKRSLAAA